jgi:GTP-binding nuclear protein Ran
MIKLLIVGDGGVGKTSFVEKLITGTFREKYIPTLGVNVKKLSIDNINFEIWDTAGVEKYRGLKYGYYFLSKCAIVIYDINNKKSYEFAKLEIIKIKKICGEIPIVLVGNNFGVLKKTKYTKKNVIEISIKDDINCLTPIVSLIEMLNLEK